MPEPIKLKRKIFLPFVLIIVTLCLLASVVLYFYQLSALNQQFAVQMHALEKAYAGLTGDRLRQLHHAADYLNALPRLTGSIARNQIPELTRLITENLRHWQDDFGFHQLIVYARNRTPIAVFPGPETPPPAAPRDLFLTARTAGRAGGIALDDRGIIAVRILAPVFSHGTVAGYIQLIEPLQSLVARLQSEFNVNINVFIHKDQLEPSQRTALLKTRNRQARPDRFPDYVPLTALPAVFENALQHLFDAGTPPQRQRVMTDPPYQLTTLDIKNSQGTPIGLLVVIRDATGAYVSLVQSVWGFGVALFAAGSIVMFIFYKLVTQSDRIIAAHRVEILKKSLAREARQTQQVNELKQFFFYDPVTELPIEALLRKKLDWQLHRPAARREGIAVITIDLLHFEDTLELFGDLVGNEILIQVTRRLKAGLRPGDVLGRRANGTFVLLLPGLRKSGAQQAAQKIYDSLHQPVTAGGIRVNSEFAIGAAIFPDHGDDPTVLINRAAVAGRRAECSRQPFVMYDHARDPTRLRAGKLASDLRHAIVNNMLRLHFLPVVDIRRARVTGAEALLRWQHAEYGPLPPADVVTLAERTGIIRELTVWVIDNALRQCAQWLEAGIRLTITVNLSPAVLSDTRFAETVRLLARQWSVDPAMLTIDIKEEALTDNSSHVVAALRHFTKQDIAINLDDAGIGPSALPRLGELRIKGLKIHESLIMRISDEPKTASVVKSTIGLAHELDLQVIAEGVTRKAVWDCLAGFGCDAIQGHFVSKPVASTVFECWLANSKFGIGRRVAACRNLNSRQS